jgi:LPS export ABC transporter permease LptG/LPS export ABC transporter permease LptF
MLRTIDRYILRETLPMVFLSLLMFTFMLMIPPIMEVAQGLMAKGVDSWTVAQLMLTLVPQGLGVTIPMAVLIGILMGFGRMSGDRETVALQACGVSIFQMLRPIIILAVVAAAATNYTMLVALPDANQAFREITYRTMAERAGDEVKPRVFYQGFPGLVLYVRDVIDGSVWSQVFLADGREVGPPKIYIAKEGRILLDRDNRIVDIVLTAGTGHLVDETDPATYDVHQFDEMVLTVDPDTIFPAGAPERGLTEMTISELRAKAVEMESQGGSSHNVVMEMHTKFSIPVACLVFALMGLVLGDTNRKDGKLASFALGIGVIFAYYIIMFVAKAMAKGGQVSPHLAMWLPNIILGGVGIFLLARRTQSVERRLSFGFLGTLKTMTVLRDPHAEPHASRRQKSKFRTPVGGSLSSGWDWPGVGLLSLLDRYVGRQYLRLVLLSAVGLLGIFYISNLVDLSDKLFKGETTGLVLLEYLWYETPRFIYYVLPISTLIASLITIGILTKSSELTVMKACGISLYRASLPLLLFSLLWSGVLFGMSESFLADTNRKADGLRNVIKGGSQETFGILNRNWITSQDGSINHYVHFDPEQSEMYALTTYRFASDEWRLTERAFTTRAVFKDEWKAGQGWVRQFEVDQDPGAFKASERRTLAIESPDYFATEQPQAERMSYQELGRHIGSLEASGADVVELRVALERKLSFPFITFILTLIAVPFAVTTGRHGALYGVGIGIVLAISYWIVISVFGAIGSAGLLTPVLAAWAPNVLFGGSAVYLLLSVRT